MKIRFSVFLVTQHPQHKSDAQPSHRSHTNETIYPGGETVLIKHETEGMCKNIQHTYFQ